EAKDENAKKRLKSQWKIPSSIDTQRFIVLAISGKMGSGKNYLLDYCVKKWLAKQAMSAVSLSYAKALKQDVMISHGFSFEDVFKTKPTEVRIVLQEYGM